MTAEGTFDFGVALSLLKDGHRVARQGWNGKGMWLALSPGNPALEAAKFWAGPNQAHAARNGGTAPVLPCITMKTATGEILMGWLASQTDMLAEDWVWLPEPGDMRSFPWRHLDLDGRPKNFEHYKGTEINRDPLPGWKNDPFPPPPEEAPPAAPPVDVTIAAAVARLLALAETGDMGKMPEKPVDLLVKVCRQHLEKRGAEIPADLRDRCNDALLAALMGSR